LQLGLKHLVLRDQALEVRRQARVVRLRGQGGNRELAIGSDEQYEKSPSWPGTGRSCRLFLRPVV
jgi:hypothetical protein